MPEPPSGEPKPAPALRSLIFTWGFFSQRQIYPSLGFPFTLYWSRFLVSPNPNPRQAPVTVGGGGDAAAGIPVQGPPPLPPPPSLSQCPPTVVQLSPGDPCPTEAAAAARAAH